WFWKGDDAASFHFLKLPVGMRDMALAPGGERFACAGSNGSVYVYTFTPGPAAVPGPQTPPKKGLPAARGRLVSPAGAAGEAPKGRPGIARGERREPLELWVGRMRSPAGATRSR